MLKAIASIAVLAASAVGAPGEGRPWATFNGDLAAQKYSSETQITPANVGRLRLAWQVHTGDKSDGTGGQAATDWSATPLFANGSVYVQTPYYRIFALAPDTGRVKWIYDPHARLKPETQPRMKSRGVAYWQAAAPRAGQPCDKIVYGGTMDGRLHAVDADTGRACAGFGRGGVLDLNQWDRVNPKWPLSALQPPTVYKDALFVGWAGRDWVERTAPPGTVFALDARTGRLKWTFHALPPEAVATTGTANVWASMSVDEARGLLYLPVSSPSPDFYGGDRKAPLPLTSAVVALNADTGQVVWSRQLVHHDLWDYDVDSAPVLVDLDRGGRKIPALVQSTKQGFLFVLNRVTGEPLFPIEERRAPASRTPGEAASTTQPYAAIPAPTVPDRWPGVWPLADLLSLGQCSRMARALRYEGRFTPPSLGAGALIYPGTAGGVEWGGGAVDPVSQTYVVNSSSTAMVYQLLTRKDYQAAARRGGSGEYFPMDGSPYRVRVSAFLNRLGMPCWKPPFGTLSAYDLRTGALLWRKPFGAVRKYRIDWPEAWGTVTVGGPLLTRTGLVFLGASMDFRVRAIEARTGRTLWRARLDAPAVANPATYSYRGRQYVVFTAGGNSLLSLRVGDQVAAFALPR